MMCDDVFCGIYLLFLRGFDQLYSSIYPKNESEIKFSVVSWIIDVSLDIIANVSMLSMTP